MALNRQIMPKDEALRRIQQTVAKPGIDANKRKQLFNLYQNISNARTITYEISQLVENLCPQT